MTVLVGTEMRMRLLRADEAARMYDTILLLKFERCESRVLRVLQQFVAEVRGGGGDNNSTVAVEL